MPKDPSKFPKPERGLTFSDEEDTKPDRFVAKCPACPGPNGEPTGEIVTETWFEGHLHKASRQTCEICWGKRFVDRAALTKWMERQR
jgi:hypothetical protein